jgi:serine/threonine-protein kinase
MGVVYRATDEVLGREVAVKVMLRGEGDGSSTERFQREARAAARLSDGHIVAVYDFGQYDDNFYLVMEIVEGGSVAGELAEHGPLSWDRAVAVIEQAAAGLAAAHAQSVVHRDIKPSNLLIAGDGTIKVADFGIAALPGSETSDLTATGQIMGSPHYLSPERARGQQAGPESDVYALGCVLYQLVTGRPPFTGDHPTAVLYQHVDATPVPPSRLRPELAGPFEPLLLRMLAKDPAERPTAEQLMSVPAAAAWFPTTALPPDPTPRSTEPVAPAEPPAERSRKPLLIAGLAVLAVVGAIAAGLVLRNAGDDLPPTVDVGPHPSRSAGTPTTSTTSTDPTEQPSTAPTRTSPSTEPTRSTPTPSSSTPTTSTTPTTTPSAPTTTAPSSSPPSTRPTPTPTKTSPSNTPSSTPTTVPSATPTASDTPQPQ